MSKIRDNQIDLSFIILTWNSERYIKDCFESIKSKCEKEGISYEIIFIDNGSTDQSVKIIEGLQKKYCEPIKLLKLSENIGTTKSRNKGVKIASGDKIAIMDSDTQILKGNIKGIFKILEEQMQIGLIAPRLVMPDGTIQNSVKKFPTFLQKLIKIPGAIFKINIKDFDFYEQFPFKSMIYVDTAISACWFMRKRIFDEVGLLDEKIFYSPEDLEFCYRIRNERKKILYYPELTILHNTQHISHKKPLSKVSLSHFFGLIYYFYKHGGWIKLKRQ